MNLILFTSGETEHPLPLADPRARHVIEILRRTTGDSFDAGLINGPRGKCRIESIGPDALTITFVPGDSPPPLSPLTLLTGLPRPQTARDILRDATTLGVATLRFVRTDRGEPGYAQSTLWTSDEWHRRLVEGAAQAFDTRLPSVHHHSSVREGIAALSAGGVRLALDNYEGCAGLADLSLTDADSATLAIGPERGWSPAERDALREGGFTLVHLGRRVLRTETACVAGITLLRARLGWL